MNREIKFRAWIFGTHGNVTFSSSKMEYGVILSERGHYLDVENNDIRGELPTVPIMQYTAFKDKNGKEIYEGDILSFENYDDFVEIIFKNGSFGYKSELGFFSLSDTNLSISEIIGNIHENSNLIK